MLITFAKRVCRCPNCASSSVRGVHSKRFCGKTVFAGRVYRAVPLRALSFALLGLPALLSFFPCFPQVFHPSLTGSLNIQASFAIIHNEASG